MRTLEEIFQGSDEKDFLLSCRFDFPKWVTRVHGYEIKWFHKEWVNALEYWDRLAILAPTGFGKTTILAVCYPLWKSFFIPNWQALITSNSMPQSTKILDQIRWEIEENELLMRMVPRGYASLIWSKTEITTATKGKIFCKPYGESAKGVHVNYVLGDEVSSYRDHKIWFRYIVTRATAKSGKVAAVSTPVDEKDLMVGNLIKNASYWHKTYPAIVNGESIWPERFSVSWLKNREKEIGKAAFAQQYLCRIVPESEEIPFPMHILVRAHDTVLRFENKRPQNETCSYYVGADFALSPVGDWSAFIVGKKRTDGKIQIVKIYRFRGMPPNTQLEILKQINQNYHPNKMLLDTSTFGTMFFKDLAADNLPVVGFSFTQENRNAAFSKAVALVNNNEIIFPYYIQDKLKETEETMMIDRLEHELSHFIIGKSARERSDTYVCQAAHDDVAIAFVLMLKAASEERRFLPYMRAR